nr:tryptophan-rich sensory protein [Nocardia carnea]
MTTPATDISRQIFVAASAVAAVVAAVFGSGALGGTPISEAAGGALAADATFVAPGGAAFSIWSLLYAGFLALAVWQLLPKQRDSPRLREVGRLVGASLLLNAAWIVAIQLGWLNISVAVIAALLATLAVIFWRCLRTRPANLVEAILLDGVLGLYLGWIVVATVANVAAALQAAAVGELGLGAEPWALVVLVVAAVIGVALASPGRAGIAVAAGIVWGLAWIAVARVEGGPESSTVAVTAGVAALVVALAAIGGKPTAPTFRRSIRPPSTARIAARADRWKACGRRIPGRAR